MPALVPSFLPPPPNHPLLKANGKSQHRSTTKTPEFPHDTQSEQKNIQVPSTASEICLTIPEVRLPVASISDEMAAAMAAGLLGHVLFLKNQIPLPINQLYRLSSTSDQNDAPALSSTSLHTDVIAKKNVKKRTDFVDAFDELSCHLRSTFSALSTALAQSKSRTADVSQLVDGTGRRGAGADENREPRKGSGREERANVYVAMVLGPTVGAPKARVILSLEGLELKVWGVREEQSANDLDGPDLENDGSSLDHDGSDSVLKGAVEDVDSGDVPPESEAEDEESEADNSAGESDELTHAEHWAFLNAQTRLLSRKLAEASASEEGGLASEMTPTHTHVLIRAPRRFTHPCWRPLQAQSSSLDNVLREFLHFSHLSASPTSTPITGIDTSAPSVTETSSSSPNMNGLKMKPKKSWKGGVKTEGVWIGCEGVERMKHCLDDKRQAVQAKTPTREEAANYKGGEDDMFDEEDEMIWWAWDGKLVGFSDW